MRSCPIKKKTWFLAAGLICVLAVSALLFLQSFSKPERLTFPQFVSKLEAGLITEVKIVTLSSLRSKLEGNYTAETGVANPYTVPVLLQYQSDLHTLLATHGFPVIEQEMGGSGFPFFAVVYVALLLMLGLFMAQVLGFVNLTPSAGTQVTSPQIKFTDVAGVDDAKDEIMEVINLIKSRSEVSRIGGTIPKGVLLVGPPGNGKTLLAKAIATEAEIPFFEMSGSSFVEKYVGTGAARVRSLFKKARKHAPCIVFIDEIDAVGSSRTENGDGGAREHNQTLNALLVEMDGASGREGVTIVAATNRKDTLDKALLRPGRFDRTLFVGLADVKGREAILRVHSRSVKLSPEVDIEEVARMTPGFSGAELASLLNEAALSAGRRRADTIGQIDIEHGRDRILLGTGKSGNKLNEKEKWLTAYHEAGHTVVNHFMEFGQRLERVTIIPRGTALGVTLMVPEEMKYGETRLKILDTICVLMGGRAAEEVFLGDVSSGASGDIGMATRYAKKMVCEWGMSLTIGMVRYENRNDEYLSLNGPAGTAVEEEIRDIINTQYARALDLVKRHRDKIVRLTQELVVRETLTKAEVDELLTPPSPAEEPLSITSDQPQAFA